jgi:hypothetical protein
MSDIRDAIELVKENIEWIFSTFVETLSRPRKRFSIIRPTSVSVVGTISDGANAIPSRVDLVPHIWIFGILSILVGTVLFGASTDMALGVLSKIVIVTLICWTLYSTILHGTCKLLGGMNNFKRTLAVSIQVLSVAFVLSSFAGFIATRAFEFLTRVEGDERTYGDILKSLGVCFAIQGMLLIVYWTVSLRSVHGITNRISYLVIPIAVIVFMLLNVVLFGALFFSDISGLNPHT